MTVVTDAYSQLAETIEAAVLAEFDDIEFLTVRHDHIHESLGHDGRTYVGISPESESLDRIEVGISALIQFYEPFNLIVDPQQAVDPRGITNKAERMKRALQAYLNAGSSYLWFFNVTSINFPNDPTGNKTRFEMRISGVGENTALVETVG